MKRKEYITDHYRPVKTFYGEEVEKPEDENQEEKQPPPPYICPIYKRDFLSFLDREKLQKVRQVSSAYNDAITRFPRLLPARFKFHSLQLCWVSD